MSEDNGTIVIKKENLWKYSTFVLLAVLIVGAFIFFTSNRGSDVTVGNVVQNNQRAGATAGATQPANIQIGDSPVLGSKSAKVTVVEFTDFSCPYCAAASGDSPDMIAAMKQNSPSWEPIVTNFIKDYVDTGKAQFVVKYSMGHTGGHPAQSVAWCLNDQNLYWKFYPLAFANQKDVEDITKMTALAKTIGADMTKLQSCLDSKKYDSKFTSEQNEGVQAGVQGTPAFFVNGQLIEGAQPYSNFKQVVDAALAK